MNESSSFCALTAGASWDLATSTSCDLRPDLFSFFRAYRRSERLQVGPKARSAPARIQASYPVVDGLYFPQGHDKCIHRLYSLRDAHFYNPLSLRVSMDICSSVGIEESHKENQGDHSTARDQYRNRHIFGTRLCLGNRHDCGS